MAITYVGGNSGTWAGATSGDNNVSLTALTGGSDSSAASGDIVVAVYATASTADRTLAIGDGTTPYTLAGSELYSNNSTNTNLRVAYKVLSAADANCVFGPTGNASDAGAAVLHVWRGVDATTQMDVAVVTATGTGSTYANGGSITPTTSGAIVLVCGGNARGGLVAALLSQTGSELSNFIAVASVDTNNASAGIGSYAWSSGAFDPTAWTAPTTPSGASWAAITLALRPASGAQTLTPSLFTNSNTFHAPTVGRGAVGLTPGLFTNSQTFYAATVSNGGASQSLTPSLFSNTNAFYSPTVTPGAVTLTPALFTNSNTFYSPTVSQAQVDTSRPSRPWGRRFLHDGIMFNVDEDDEELLMMIAAAAPLLNRSHYENRMY